MNMKSYLFSMLALSALISCSKKLDEPQAPTQKVDADAAYMSVTIEAPEAGASTYAHEGQEQGSEAESSVSTAYVVTFDANRQKLGVVTLNLDGAKPDLGMNDKKVPNKTAGEAFKVAPSTSYLLMVLNPSRNLLTAMSEAITYADFQKAVYEDKEGVLALSTDGHFTMINEGALSQKGVDFIDEGLVECTGNVIAVTEDKDAEVAKTEAKAHPVNITVVRLVARVRLTNQIGMPFGGECRGEAEGATVSLSGWQFNTTNRSYLPYSSLLAYKDDAGSNIFDNRAYRKDGNFDGTEDASEFNWLQNDNNLEGLPLSIEWRNNNDPAYVMENTMSAAAQNQIRTTKIVLQAQYAPKGMTQGETWIAFSADGATVKNLTVSDAETQAGQSVDLGELMDKIAVKIGMTDKTELFATLKADKVSAPNSALDNIGYVASKFVVEGSNAFVRIYRHSICYYDLLIKHNSGIAGINMLGKWGVVRNNAYTLTVNSISKPGLPFIPDPTDPTIVDPQNPTPETPNEDTEAYLSVAVQIAPWTLWSQNVDL